MAYLKELRKVLGSQPLIVAGACVFIEDGSGRILLQCRSDNKTWGLPGGSLELNETLEECARREIFEETRLSLGDISFFYDSNALWNNYLSPRLKIIVVNNSGGNIFSLIDGPKKVKDFEKFFETKHRLSAEHLATMYGLPYYFCDGGDTLEATLEDFLNHKSNMASVLEIKTDGAVSASVYKGYFEYLKNNRL